MDRQRPDGMTRTRYLRLAGFLAASLLVLASTGCDSAPLRIKVLSYNIHHGEGLDGRFDLERIARIIASTDPDLVAIQEVDVNTERSGGLDQARELARLTGMHMLFGKAIDFAGGEYGNVILSRRPIARHSRHELPQLGDHEHRNVLEAAVAFEGRDSPVLITFLATHFEVSSPEVRTASANYVNELAAARADQLMILAGDLNAIPDAPPLRTLIEQWGNATAGVDLLTSPADAPQVQLDYILTHPRTRWKVVESRVLQAPVASDHLPILAILELNP